MNTPSPPDMPQGSAFSTPSDRLPWSDSDDNTAVGSDPVFPGHAVGSDTGSEPSIGHVGRYSLRRRIGQGKLGAVYSAYDPVSSRLVAIKTVQLELDSQERVAFNSIFLSEARIAASLSHPYIVTVYDAGISEQGAYVAMELLRGRDLQQLRLEGWRPSPRQAAMIVQRIADALAHAHSRGAVHCDIKPANIFMVGPTQPRVLDFGIARLALAHQASTPENSQGASPYHIAPEQLLQQPLDGRCDVFSLGVLLYELLTNALPFQGNNSDEVTRAVLESKPEPAHKLMPGVPKTLAELAAWAMEKNPNARLRSASVMSRELTLWLAASQPKVKRASVLKRVTAAWRRSRWVQSVVVAGLALIALGTWFHLAPQTESQLVDLLKSGGLVQAPSVVPVPAIASAAAPASVEVPPPALVPVAADTLPTSVAVSAAGSAAIPAAQASAPDAAPETTVAEKVQTSAAVPTSTSEPTIEATQAPPTPSPQTTSKVTEVWSSPAVGGVSAPVAVAAMGLVRIAVSPWGQVDVDGVDMGTAPPLRQLTLSKGKHTVTLRNGDFPSHRVEITVRPDRPTSVKHKFGS